MNKFLRIILVLVVSAQLACLADGSLGDFLNGFSKDTQTEVKPKFDENKLNAKGKQEAKGEQQAKDKQNSQDNVNAMDLLLEQAREQLSQYIGKEYADVVMDYAKKIANGEMTLEDALSNGLQSFIKDKLPSNTAAAVNEFLTSIAEGDGLADFAETLGDLAQSAAQDGIASLLEKAGLTKEQQQKIMEAVESVVNGDWTSAWDSVKGGVSDFISGIVSETFGPDVGQKIKDAVSSIINDGASFLSNAVDAVSNLLTSELENKIGAQLDKLAQKYPGLGKVFEALGLNGGSGAIDALTNCWNALQDGQKLLSQMQNLVSKITDTLNKLAEKLKNFVQNVLSKVVNTVMRMFEKGLNNLVDMLAGTVKAQLFLRSVSSG